MTLINLEFPNHYDKIPKKDLINYWDMCLREFDGDEIFSATIEILRNEKNINSSFNFVANIRDCILKKYVKDFKIKNKSLLEKLKNKIPYSNFYEPKKTENYIEKNCDEKEKFCLNQFGIEKFISLKEKFNDFFEKEFLEILTEYDIKQKESEFKKVQI